MHAALHVPMRVRVDHARGLRVLRLRAFDGCKLKPCVHLSRMYGSYVHTCANVMDKKGIFSFIFFNCLRFKNKRERKRPATFNPYLQLAVFYS